MRTLISILIAAVVGLLPWGSKPATYSAPANGAENSVMAAVAASFPATGILDSFDRGNGTIGAKWSADSSEFTIAGAQLKTSTEGMILWNPTSFRADQEAYVTFANIVPSSTDMDLVLKSQKTNSKASRLEVTYNPALKIARVLTYKPGKGNVQYGADIPVTLVNGDVFGARATSDGQVYVYKNGSLLASRDAAAWADHSKGGYVGLLSLSGAGSIFDNFGGGTLAAQPAPTSVATSSPRPTATKTGVPPPTSTRTLAPTATRTATANNTALPPTNTPRPTATNTTLPPATATSRPTSTRTPLPSATGTAVSTNTPRPTATHTLAPTSTRGATLQPTSSNTPRPTATWTPAPAPGSRPLKYYLVDRVLNNADFAKLASWGVNTAVVDMGITASSSWSSVVTAATNAGIDIVIWPNQGGDVPGCSWETPFNSPQNGNYIWRITGMLDALGGNPHVIGIVTAHEAPWNQDTCRTSIADMAAVKNQIKDYIFAKFGRTDFKVWNYIDNISDIPYILDYSGPSDYLKIMDVAVTWEHCAGDAENACDTGSYSALSKIKNDRNLLNAAGTGVNLVYIMQTFTTSGSYGTKFTLSQLENYSCEFLNTKALEGFGFYTWDAGWWPDLHSWTDLQPAVPYIYTNCVNSTGVSTATPTATRTLAPTATRTTTATSTPKPTATRTSTPKPTGTSAAGSFSFISFGDSQDNSAGLTTTASQMKSLNPAFTIFNGDLENDGVTTTRMDAMTGALGGLLSSTFPVRGNHDDHISGSAGLWEDYFNTKWGTTRSLPAGVTNYVSMNSTNTYLNYSFDYGNSRFIGVDVPGDADLLTSAEYTFLDQRLTNAESIGLTHAFIYFHGPEYCVESIHCNCSSATDGSCTPTAFVNLINRHPIVTATIHGHEHILGYVQVNNSRVAGLTHPYVEFLTSSSTPYNSYNSYMYPARMDYYYQNVGNGCGFALITVSGNSVTFSIYLTGTSVPVWTRTFTK